jgi:hypothetical protein
MQLVYDAQHFGCIELVDLHYRVTHFHTRNVLEMSPNLLNETTYIELLLMLDLYFTVT